MTIMPFFVGVGDRAPYALAFLSSTAIELFAVAVLLTIVANAATRRGVERRASADAARITFRIDIMKLYKLIIPVLSLGFTVWLWTATRGA